MDWITFLVALLALIVACLALYWANGSRIP
jgi:hypothetical protein